MNPSNNPSGRKKMIEGALFVSGCRPVAAASNRVYILRVGLDEQPAQFIDRDLAGKRLREPINIDKLSLVDYDGLDARE